MADSPAQGGRSAPEKGRPSLSPILRRSLPLRVWASYAERDAITKKARLARLPVADFMRRAALGKTVDVVEVPAVNADTWRALTQIGHHLNRIVRAVEGSKGEHVPADLLVTIASLRAHVDALALGMATGVHVPPQSDFAETESDA